MYKQELVEKQLAKTIKIIEKQLGGLETAIHKHIKKDERVFQKVSNICKIKVLGILTAVVIIAETNGFVLFENAKQLVS